MRECKQNRKKDKMKKGHKRVHALTVHPELQQAMNFYDEPKTRALLSERFKKLWGRANTSLWHWPQTTLSQEMVFRLVQIEGTMKKVRHILSPKNKPLPANPSPETPNPAG